MSHTLAAVALEMAKVGRPPEVHFGWTEESPVSGTLGFLLFGEGNVPWMVEVDPIVWTKIGPSAKWIRPRAVTRVSYFSKVFGSPAMHLGRRPVIQRLVNPPPL